MVERRGSSAVKDKIKLTLLGNVFSVPQELALVGFYIRRLCASCQLLPGRRDFCEGCETILELALRFVFSGTTLVFHLSFK